MVLLKSSYKLLIGKKHNVISDEDYSYYLAEKTNKRTKRTMLQKNGDIECLPRDILFKIFTLIPAKYLHNSIRLVCKSWRTIIQDPHFINAHLDYYSKSKSNLIFQAKDRDSRKSNMISLKINRGSLETASLLCRSRNFDEGPTIKASCNGLVLIRFGCDLFIANPITKWSSKLPSPGQSSIHTFKTKYSFAYNHSAKEYKVVCSFQEREMLFICIIHTVGTDSWREIKMPINNVKMHGFDRPILTSDGALHWLTRCTTEKYLESNESFNSHILSMEVNKEEFRLTRLPPDGGIDQLNSILLELGGSLSLFYYVTKAEMDVWVLESYHKEVWVKKYYINLNTRLWRGFPIASLYKDEVIIFSVNYGSQMFMYDLKLQELKQLEGHQSLGKFHFSLGNFCLKFLQHPLAHVDSLVTLGSTCAQEDVK